VRRRARVDRHQAEIVRVLRQLGFLVFDCSRVGQGFPDLAIHRGDHGHVQLVELKTPTGKLTPDQQRFIQAGWPVKVVRSIEDALLL
jgi:hypothetical protein